MGENSGQIGTKDISNKYPVPSSSGLEEDDYHEGRVISLEAEEGSVVSSKIRELL